MGDSGDWEGVAHMLSEMAVRGVPKDIVTYNTMISMHAKLADWEKCWKLLQDMEEDGITPGLHKTQYIFAKFTSFYRDAGVQYDDHLCY